MTNVGVRYIVNDVDKAIKFYTDLLGFQVIIHPDPAFAILKLDNFNLMLSSPKGSGGGAQPMLDGSKPEPGGWNRIQIQVNDLESRIKSLKELGANFRSDMITGIGAKQILLNDPSGNVVELYENLQR